MELTPGPFEEQSRAAPEYQSSQGFTGTHGYYNIRGHYSTLESTTTTTIFYFSCPEKFTVDKYMQRDKLTIKKMSTAT